MKLLTHVYLTNLIIKELEDKSNGGKVWIPVVGGYYSGGTLREDYPPSGSVSDGRMVHFPTNGPSKDGKYAVPEEVSRVILKHKAFFRGGAAGCDTLPDMLFSQFIVHGTDSGLWLEYLFDHFKRLPKGEERDQAYAFILGYMTHFATDMFGHGYVNEYAGGWFIWRELTAEKHMILEEFMDDVIWNSVPDAEREIAVPSKFLASCFFDILEVDEQIRKIALKKDSVKDPDAELRCENLVTTYRKGLFLAPLRSFCFDYSIVEKYVPGEPHVYPERIRFQKVDLMNWINTWGRITQALLRGEPTDGAIGLFNNVVKEFADMMGKRKEKGELMEKLRKGLGSTGKERLLNDFREFGNPSGNYKEYPYGIEGKEYKAFSLCLTASKFCIIGCDELNRYLECPPNGGVFKKDRSVHSVSRIKVTISSDKAISLYHTKGETDCSFDIVVRNDKGKERLAYSAFMPKGFKTVSVGSARIEGIEFTLDLPTPLPLKDIARFAIKNSGEVTWTVDSIKVSDADRNDMVIAEMRSSINKPLISERGKTCPFEVDRPKIEEVMKKLGDAPEIDIPHGIMSWLYSLDGMDETGDIIPRNKPWERDEYVIYRKAVGFSMGLCGDLSSGAFDDDGDAAAGAGTGNEAVQKAQPPFDLADTPHGYLLSPIYEGEPVTEEEIWNRQQKKDFQDRFNTESGSGRSKNSDEGMDVDRPNQGEGSKKKEDLDDKGMSDDPKKAKSDQSKEDLDTKGMSDGEKKSSKSDKGDSPKKKDELDDKGMSDDKPKPAKPDKSKEDDFDPKAKDSGMSDDESKTAKSEKDAKSNKKDDFDPKAGKKGMSDGGMKFA